MNDRRQALEQRELNAAARESVEQEQASRDEIARAEEEKASEIARAEEEKASEIARVDEERNASKKVPAGVFGICLGFIGVHKFVLGYTSQGLYILLTTLFTRGWAGIIWGIIGFIEGIIYLRKSDDEFVATYVVGKKGWF